MRRSTVPVDPNHRGGTIMQDITQSIEACAAYYGDNADAVRQYLIEGQKRALALPNRGPLRFNDNGDIHSEYC